MTGKRSLPSLLAAAALALLTALCAPAPSDGRQDYEAERQQMVEHQLLARDITDPRVLAAMGRVPRHLFVPERIQRYAYIDRPLPIGRGQTISQPYIVALMTQLSWVREDSRVLEIGTGSGYQAAVLAEIAAEVYSIEIDCVLAERARLALEAAGYGSVVSKCGDGYFGWPEHAPFDAVIVTAAPPRVPEPLLEQLAPGGILVVPVGPTGEIQILKTFTRTADGFEEWDIELVAFVPMTGRVREH